MRVWGSITIFMLLAVQASVAFASDDAIFPGSPAPADELPEPPRITATFMDTPATTELPKWFKTGSRVFSEVLRKFLFSLIANQGGLEHPMPDESPNDIYSQRVGASRLKLLLQGAGNLRLLNGPYVSTEIQGGVGVEYDFVLPDTTDHSTLVALRFSPVYGEIAMVNMPIGTLFENTLPKGFFVGSALGLEVSKRFGIVEPGFRAYTRTEWDTLGRQVPALSYYAAMYCRIHLKDLLISEAGPSSTVVVMPIISYFDRGNAQADMYAWNRAQDYSNYPGVKDLRNFWEAMLKLEIRF